MDYRLEAPGVITGFLQYHETIKGHSRKTVDEYYLDLRTFFRYLKQSRGLAPRDAELEEISIKDVDLDLVASVTLSDVYDFLSYLARDRDKRHNSPEAGQGLTPSSRARKIAAIRSFYKYLTLKTKQLDVNPVAELDSPKLAKTLPKYLSLDQSRQLLDSVEGRNEERDYCILTLFLNCGLRISEMVGLNVSDVTSDHLRVIGKGNKQRIVYLNEACLDAIRAYQAVRSQIAPRSQRAFFLSSRRERISRSTVHNLVKKHLAHAGLDTEGWSAHKLRHTAATLMLHNGVDVRTLQELLGHEHLNTTEIYTHVESSDLQQAANLSPLSGFSRQEKPPEDEEENEEE